MTTKSASYALKCLSAADIAPDLCDQIQYLYAHNLREARQATIEMAAAMVEHELEKLPRCLDVKLDDTELTDLINCLF